MKLTNGFCIFFLQNTLSLLYFTSDSYIIVKDYQQGAAWIIYQNNAWPSSFLAVRLRFSDAKMKEYADKAEELGAMLATEVVCFFVIFFPCFWPLISSSPHTN